MNGYGFSTPDLNKQWLGNRVLTMIFQLQNKELEASEERKRKAKQLEMQRKEALRTGRTAAPRTPSYPVYSPPSRPTVPDTYDSYEAEKKKSFAKYVCFSQGYCHLPC